MPAAERLSGLRPVARLALRAPAPPAAAAPSWVPLALILAVAAAIRLWRLDDVGFNSDEAVYSGQAASIAHHPGLEPLFPIFRAHPLLFQTFLSLGFRLHLADGFERLASALVGIATVWVVYRLGRLLYGHRSGLLAALLLALMPYHVAVTRQVLLDGPMTLLCALTFLLLAHYVVTGRAAWLYAAGASMGLTVLAKETSVLLLGAVFAFFALTPELRTRVRDLAGGLAVCALVALPFPLSVMLAGSGHAGHSYLTWQLFRRSNHDWLFYGATVPRAIGPLVLVAAGAGLWLLRREGSWRETLLLSWIAIPVVFFELWPVKGYQYLLPIAPPLALLAGRALSRCPRERALRWGLAGLVALSLLIPAWGRVAGQPDDRFLAGSGGLPSGREAGRWIDRNAPAGSAFMTIGPSMANLVQYYGRRKAYGLSVSPNPLNRNPSYEPLSNPDAALREGRLQYVVWDAFSARRSPGFSERLHGYVRRYGGRAVHTETLPALAAGGEERAPAIVVYEVHP
jgi:hypothetical protein